MGIPRKPKRKVPPKKTPAGQKKFRFTWQNVHGDSGTIEIRASGIEKAHRVADKLAKKHGWRRVKTSG